MKSKRDKYMLASYKYKYNFALENLSTDEIRF